MIEQAFNTRTLRILILAACTGIVVVVMQRYATLINTFLIALIVVLAASPLLRGLQKRGISDILALIITLVVVLLVGIILLLLVVGSVARLAQSVPEYTVQLEQALDDIQNLLQDLGLASADAAILTELINPGELFTFALGFVGGLVGAISDIAVVVLIIIFMFVDALSFPQKLQAQITSGYTHLKTFHSFNEHIRRYISITTLVGAVTGFGNTIFLLIIGVDFPVLWGILAFLLSYIPTIGFWIALIPPAILAWLEFGWQGALIVFIGYVLINGVAENVVKPRYMGRGLDLSAGVIVISLIIWGFILGPWGAILAVPLTLAIKELILEPDPSTRWVASLMGGWEEPKEEGEE